LNAYRLDLFHSSSKAVILFMYSFYISTLVKTGNIEYFIAPSMYKYVTWTVIGLFLVALYQLYETLTLIFEKTSASCNCGHMPSKSPFKSSVIYLFFILPVALGFLLPNIVMGSAIAAQKGVNLSGDAIFGSSFSTTERSKSKASNRQTNGIQSPEELFPVKVMANFSKFGMKLYQQSIIDVTNERYMETLGTLNLYPENFIGKQVQITGFVYRDDKLGSNQFVLGRIGVSCCAADAIPVGVIIEDLSAFKYANDTWLAITGTIDKTLYKNKEVLMIKPTQIEKSSVPSTGFYVYRDTNFYINP
jgi:putative membrane protein